MLAHWWATSCKFCLQIRRIMLDLFNVLATLLLVGVFMFAGLGIYWLWFDTDPIVYYGNNGIAEFSGDNIIFHLDATRIRDCPAMITRKIGGCGQIDIPPSHAVTPVGQKAGPFSMPLAAILQSYPKSVLSGNVCYLISTATGYCNPAQKLLHVPIVAHSPPIYFIPVARIKSTPSGEMP